MFRASDIRTLANIMGWRQNYGTDNYTIDEALTVSTFGQYYQDVHPLLTLDNLQAVAPDFTKITFPTWTALLNATTGQRVIYNGVTYIALQNSVGQDPEADDQNDPVYWDLFDAFSDWLKQKTEASVIKFASDIFNEKLANKTAKNLIESRMLFDGAGRISNTLTSTNSLVGFEVIPIRAKGVTLKIDKIGLQFAGGVESLVLYVMHTSQSEPVTTLTLARSKNGSLEWFVPTTDLYLPYDGPNNGPGGSWFLVYDQFALGEGIEAVIKDRDWSKQPCGTCTAYELENWRTLTKYLEVYPFKTTSQEAAPTMWDIADNVYTSTSNYGLNLQVSVQCDVTDIMLEQKKAFENAIGLQVASDLIREMAYNPNYNVNRTNQNHSKAELLYELDGDSQGYKKSGINYRLLEAKKAISLDINSLSRVCFTCRNGGVKYRTM